MEEQTYTILFGIAFGLVSAYLVFIQVWFRAAKRHDADLFVLMGEPDLFTNNTPKSLFAVFKVLFGLKYMSSESSSVRVLGSVVFGLLMACLVLYGVLLFGFTAQIS